VSTIDIRPHTVPGTVIKIGAKYVMYYHRNYSDGKGEIFVATSNSPTTGWSAYGISPVLTAGSPGNWDEKWVTMPNVVFDNGTGTYYMFYEGSDYIRSSIGFATSPDGYSWTKQTVNAPLLVHGSPGWDGSHAGTPFVIKQENTYYMYYHGNGDGIYTDRIGYATSSSISGPYTKYSGNPVFPPSSSGWDSSWVGQRAIFNFKGMWVMLYEGNASTGVNGLTGTQTGIATANSLNANWNRYQNNPVFKLACLLHN
jgi:beta-xylosidase